MINQTVLTLSFLTLSVFSLSSFAKETGNSETIKFTKLLEKSFKSAEKLPLNFSEQKLAVLEGECVKRTLYPNGDKRYWFSAENESLAIVNRTKLAKTTLYYGLGESYEHFARLRFPLKEKYSAAFLDDNRDLVQDTVQRGGGGEGSSDYFTHRGRTYLREGRLNGNDVYFFVHRTKVYRDLAGGAEEYTDTDELFCYFNK